MEGQPQPADTRHPYTYACDLIRIVAGYGEGGTKLSRSDASRIRQLFADVLRINDEELAEKLAAHFKANQKSLTDKAVGEFMGHMFPADGGPRDEG